MRTQTGEKVFVKLPLRSFHIFIPILLVDQILKHWATTSYQATINTGVSLGLFRILATWPVQLLVFILFIGLYLVIRKKISSIYTSHSFSLIFAGATSNLLDRLFYGGVVDYLVVPIFHLHNNLADWSIFIGVIVLLYSYFNQYPSHEIKSPDNFRRRSALSD